MHGLVLHRPLPLTSSSARAWALERDISSLDFGVSTSSRASDICPVLESIKEARALIPLVSEGGFLNLLP